MLYYNHNMHRVVPSIILYVAVAYYIIILNNNLKKIIIIIISPIILFTQPFSAQNVYLRTIFFYAY